MAGPLRPRWVMRSFSRKAGGRVRCFFATGALTGLAAGFVAMTSALRPERSAQSRVSSGLKTKGTRAGRQGTISRLKCWAIS